MATNELRKMLAHLPAHLDLALLEFGVSATELPVDCIELDPIPMHVDTEAEILAVSPYGIEVVELYVETIVIEAPSCYTEVCHG
jgi:hypothetical protein